MDTSQYLFSNYAAWAETAGYQAVSQARFSRNLLDLLESQLGITDVEKKTSNRGVYIAGISLRLPGMIKYPLLITADETSEGLVSGEVKDVVKGQTLTEKGLFESERFLGENKGEINPTVPPPPPPFLVEPEPDDKVRFEASPSQNPSSPDAEAFTKPITESVTDPITPANESVGDDAVTPLQRLEALQGDEYALGELLLSFNEKELREVEEQCTPEKIQALCSAANKAWKPGVNRDACYRGERVEIWQVGQGRDVKVKSKGGTAVFAVKRGDLTPWLGLRQHGVT